MKSLSHKNILPLLLLLLIYISNFLVKLIVVYNIPISFRISAFIRLIVEVILIILAFKLKISSKNLKIIGALIIGFFLGQFFLKEYNIYSQNFLEEILNGDIYYLNKYILIILFVAVYKKLPGKNDISNQLINATTYILIINSLLILLGFVFEINLFKSFPSSERFGYSGLFTKSGEAVLLYILFSIIFYIKFLNGKSIYPVLFFIIIAFLTGKKIAVLSIVLFYVFHFCVVHKGKVYFRLIGGLLLGFSLFFKDYIVSYVVKFFPFWEQLLKKESVWTILTSTRNLNYFRAKSFIQDNWSFVNYLFGGVNYNKNTKVEIDPLDTFMFFGLLGGSLYIYFIIDNYLAIKNRAVKFLTFGFLILSMLYGAFFFNILLMFTLYVFVEKYKTLDGEFV